MKVNIFRDDDQSEEGVIRDNKWKHLRSLTKAV